MDYTCPLCKQPVSSSLYQKITGIWEERKKALARVKEQRRRLLKQFQEKERRLTRQASQFRKQRTRIIREAVAKRTQPLQSRIRALRRKEKEIERSARVKIQRATTQADRQAERHWSRRFNSLREDFRASIKDRVRKEKERTTNRIERRYRKLRNSFRTTLQQMQVKENRLQEQASQIRELQRQLNRETTPQMEGLLYEEKLLKELRRRFRHDRFKHEGKRGDVLHWPMTNNHVAGLIVYECKRVQRYLPAYVKQAGDAKEKRKADFAILVTSAMKKRTHGFFAEKGVLVVHPAGVVHLVSILRDQIVRIDRMKLSHLQRSKAVKLTLQYLEGPEFANSMEGIMQQALTLYEDMMREVKNHIAVWRKREAGYKKIYEDASTVKVTTRALLSGEPEFKKLIRAERLPPILELPELEKSVASSESAENVDVQEDARQADD